MNAGVRLKLFLSTLALVVGVGLVCGVYMERHLRAWLLGRIETELLGQARLARDLVELLPQMNSAEGADHLADRLGASTQARVTIVRGDGSVIGDSELSLPEVQHVENHLHRPEIEQALAAGHGAATRYSTSVRHDMFYAAVPYQRAVDRPWGALLPTAGSGWASPIMSGSRSPVKRTAFFMYA